MGRPGLIGMAARTAVVAGTATAVSGNVQRRQAQRAEDKYEQQAYEQQQQQAQMQQAAQDAAAQQAAAAPAAPAAAPADDMMAKIQQLATLHSQGILSDEEFSAAKAKLLA
ncbi:SHOCT domain-containing protein [Leifsonia shinshuensis]|uniref:SHOCT domain-containing protein n=2 Tax=Leifsonia shinshuensis TaxID=150026 RepID=A0A7G6YH19_9MICO|nr:SHOCT domain-containing protein [Leifsonia shinshuensis]QNE37784.1 SHOCT domain-containing protein [Leifsonia shinshuensis]